jgi:RNA polymerase sigma-70 factor (ECF subfamily)
MRARSVFQELVEKAQEGDREAFGELARGYRARLEALVRSRMGEAVRKALEPEDVVQETLTRALQSLDRFRWTREDSFLRWLGGIAENIIVKAASRLKRSATLQIPEDLPASGTSVSRRLRRNERLERLKEAISKLTPDQKEVVRLARIEGLKIKEIAARTGRSADAVKQLMLRGLRSLRRNLAHTESLHLPDEPLGTGES